MLKYHFSLLNKDVLKKIESDKNFKIDYNIFLEKYVASLSNSVDKKV